MATRVSLGYMDGLHSVWRNRRAWLSARQLFSIGMSMFTLSAGLGIVEHWVKNGKHRVNPGRELMG